MFGSKTHTTKYLNPNVSGKPFLGVFFVNFLILGGVAKMAAPRQCFFDTFNGQGPRSAWGPPEIQIGSVPSGDDSAAWRLQAGVKNPNAWIQTIKI